MTTEHGEVHALVQASVSMPLPSSHTSPVCRTPSPHTLQVSRQRLPFPPAGEPGGSQVSFRLASTIPSPHTGIVQLFRQPSVSTPLPSSHISPGCWTPSPHTLQVSRQRLPFPPAGRPDERQVAFRLASTIPSPHTGIVQLFRQPSVLMPLPSSHIPPGCWTA